MLTGLIKSIRLKTLGLDTAHKGFWTTHLDPGLVRAKFKQLWPGGWTIHGKGKLLCFGNALGPTKDFANQT